MLYVEFARRQKRLSQEKLGIRTGITQAFISLMELGRGIPTPAQLSRLSVELGLPSELLLKPVVILTGDGTLTSNEALREPNARLKETAVQTVERARQQVTRYEAELAEAKLAEVATQR